MKPNKPDSANPAMTLWLAIEAQWRRVADLGRHHALKELRMSKEQEIHQLTEHFRALGAFDPESWARSQIEEGIPQYARLVFLRQAWQSIIADGDTSWIEPQIQAAERG